MQIFIEYLRKILSRRRRSSTESGKSNETPLSANLSVNLKALRGTFSEASDFVVKEFHLGGQPSQRMAIVYIDNMTDGDMIRNTVLTPLMILARPVFTGKRPEKNLYNDIRSALMPAQEMSNLATVEEVIRSILDGDAALLANGLRSGIRVETRGFETRNIEEPTSEVAIRGTREGMQETAAENVVLIRRRLKCSSLAVERFTVGRRSRTDVRILYVRDVAPAAVVDEIRRRLESIDVDVVHASRTIQEFIADSPFSIFPTVKATERPDTAVACLVEGRVVLLVDNDPFVLIMPMEFWAFFSSAQDYNFHFYIPSVLRVLSFGAFLLASLLTPIYVALITFHQELIPLTLLLNIAATEAGVPLPAAVNAFGVEVVLEVLREAGARLPRAIGQAVSIVGAIVLGQAAVQAGFVSPGLVIVAATAAIFSFAVPQYEVTTAWRLMRFPLLALASTLGFYGVAWGVVIIVFHLASLKSFGVPYLALYSPGRVSELGDQIIMLPHPLRRPVRPVATGDRVRRGEAPRKRGVDDVDLPNEGKEQ
ncbi:MAG: spore germination protein [Bacillota bacterium]